MGFDLGAFRDPDLARTLSARIGELCAGRTPAFMEVCGTHTVAIARSGLRSLLPEALRLVSGPGCPVCVTPQSEVEAAVTAAGSGGVTLATFGDMLRVPGRGGSLEGARSAGADVRVIFSPRDGLELARENPGRQVVLVGVGFETTIPAFAAAVLRARDEGLDNFSVLNSFRLVPPALRAVLEAGPKLDGFILPGHVSAIIGAEPYALLPEAGKAAVIAGFEPVDVLAAVSALLEQMERGEPRVAIGYRRAVRPEGNPRAREVMAEVFEPADACWRGLGSLPGSGLGFRDGFSQFDAAARLGLPAEDAPEPEGCRCAEVLTGRIGPRECAQFASACTPEDPVGPCMVSSEGSCAAEYRYGRGGGA
ncbi:MAG: hydrogenase formation protein HypD [Planctomycetota bacterium]